MIENSAMTIAMMIRGLQPDDRVPCAERRPKKMPMQQPPNDEDARWYGVANSGRVASTADWFAVPKHLLTRLLLAAPRPLPFQEQSRGAWCSRRPPGAQRTEADNRGRPPWIPRRSFRIRQMAGGQPARR